VSAPTLEYLLEQMRDRCASDLLLTAGAVPQLRVNGVFEPCGTVPLDAEAVQGFITSVLTVNQAAALERDKSLDFTKSFDAIAICRFNVYWQRGALAIAVRMIPFVIPGMEELGLPAIVTDFASRPHGLVLITGPAGSGKSTTMAAMIDFINHTQHLHVICIEDPIEYLHRHGTCIVDQREIGIDAHTFADALRSVFRQSPDVIMVGEMRDLETVQCALTLAETGHLILATLHTPDTTQVIQRIVDVFPASRQRQIYLQLAMVLQGVIAQRLLITRGGDRRVLACEVINVNQAIRNLIRETHVEQIYSVIQTSAAEGMITMNESLKRLCDTGCIDVETALRYSARPKELRRMLTPTAG
jgi:twitching motility protein PilT